MLVSTMNQMSLVRQHSLMGDTSDTNMRGFGDEGLEGAGFLALTSPSFVCQSLVNHISLRHSSDWMSVAWSA